MEYAVYFGTCFVMYFKTDSVKQAEIMFHQWRIDNGYSPCKVKSIVLMNRHPSFNSRTKRRRS